MIRIKSMRSKFFATVLVLLSMHSGLSNPALASMTTNTCSSDVYNAMENRAWLEAQREITVNQNLIVKPDSVLEYTCFDKFLNVLAQQADNMFSQNKSAWSGSIPIVTGSDMENALDPLVLDPVDEYLKKNFSHKFLGGRASSLDNNIGSNVSPGGYTCDRMQKVWDEAKCTNFATDPKDGFMTFNEHKSTDPRRYPTPCGADSRWGTNINAVFTSPSWKSGVSSTMTSTYSAVRGLTAYVSACASSVPIPTGLTIKKLGSSLPDVVCSNPGCYFTGTSCDPY